MGAIVNLFKIGLMLIVAFVVINLFIQNAAAWGNGVGSFFTAFQTFLSSFFSSSPLG